jgi:hypothetical protein
VLRPFFSAILWALILSFSTWPIYTRLLARLNGRQTLASALMTFGVALVLVAPLAFLGATLADHVAGVIEVVRVLLNEGLPEAPPWLGNLPLFGSDLLHQWQDLAGSEADFGPRSIYTRRRGPQPAAAHRSGRRRTDAERAICFFYRDWRDAAAHLYSGGALWAIARHLLDVAG